MKVKIDGKVKEKGGFEPCPVCHGKELSADFEETEYNRTTGFHENSGCANVLCGLCEWKFKVPTKKNITDKKALVIFKKKWNKRA